LLVPSPIPVQPFCDQCTRGRVLRSLENCCGAELREILCAHRMIHDNGARRDWQKPRWRWRLSAAAFPSFNGDCWLVDLVSLSDPGLVPSTVGGILRPEARGDPISSESVARAIGTNKLLLVLDNCEHVIDAAAAAVATIVTGRTQTVNRSARSPPAVDDVFAIIVVPEGACLFPMARGNGLAGNWVPTELQA